MTLHTQREEDIKEFDRQNFTDMWAEDESNRCKKFISNIYIKIAERDVEHWQALHKRFKAGYEVSGNEFAKWVLSIASRELTLAQEELNKLKA